MTTKKPTARKKPVPAPPADPVEAAVEAPAVEAEPEPVDDEDVDPIDGTIGRGYYERAGAFVRVHGVGPGTSIPLAVTFVSADDRAVEVVTESDAPQLGLMVTLQSADAFEAAGFRRIAREGVPAGWRKLLARVKP